MSEQLTPRQVQHKKHLDLLKKSMQLRQANIARQAALAAIPPVPVDPNRVVPKFVPPPACTGPGCGSKPKSAGGCGCGGRKNSN